MDRSGSGSLQLEQVGAPRELQGGGLGSDAPARGQDVGDVLGAEGLQLQPVVEGAGDGLACRSSSARARILRRCTRAFTRLASSPSR